MSKPVSLFRFLAGIGGLRDERGELSAMNLDKRRVYVTAGGRGHQVRLVRRDGLPLDRARELAAEAGFMHAYGPPHIAMAETTPADLLDLIRAEMLGDKVYSEHAMPVMRTSGRVYVVREAENEEIVSEDEIMTEAFAAEAECVNARELVNWAKAIAAEIGR